MDGSIPDRRVVVIGSGFGGLSIAAMLAKKGHEVEVLEKNSSLGGRANRFELDGFTFDTGPSWYLMPDVFESWFSMMGERVEDHLDLVKLTPSYKIWYKDTQKVVQIFSDLEKDKATLEELEPGSYPRIVEYLKRAEEQYHIAVDRFMYKNYDSIGDFFTPELLREGRKLSVLRRMHGYVKRYAKTPELQKILEYHLVFLGSSPYNTPALYNIMSHVDFNMGVFYPQGGIYEIIEALVRIGKKHGVKFRTDSSVSRIDVQDGVARSVVLDSGESLPVDLLVSNADYHHTENVLLPPEARTYSERFWKKRVYAPSAFIMYLGVEGRIPEFIHHNFLFSKDWRKNFAEIFDRPTWPTDPSIYVCAPSVTDPSIAPEGMENLFVLVPIAPGLEYEDADLETYSQEILQRIESHMGVPDLKSRIRVKRFFSVKDFVSRFHSPLGTALGLAHTLRQTAVFRPDTQSKKVSNLFYVGANTNPGIGMPTCLISSQLTYKRIIGDRSSGAIKSL